LAKEDSDISGKNCSIMQEEEKGGSVIRAKDQEEIMSRHSRPK